MTIDLRHPLPGRRPLVVGAARSGLAAAALLRRHGLPVTVCDRAAAADRREAEAALRAIGAEARWGRDDEGLLAGHDLVVWSPGIPADHDLGRAARAAAIPLLSELELGYLASRAPLIAITGTNGKSTTTDLTGALVRATGRAVEVCGNIGRAICEVADLVEPTGLVVAEVSSFQLEAVDRLQPFVAGWLNLTPDHLDRHRDLDTYGGLKARLFARQGAGDYAVFNADDPAVMARRAGAGEWMHFSARGPVEAGAFAEGGEILLARRGGRERVMAASSLRIRGPHNLANALAALSLTLPLEIPPAALQQVLERYPGLEHRLEPAGRVEGIEFVNDSKATNLSSMEVALASFAGPVILIAGGRDKGQDFRPAAGLAGRRVRLAVLIGEGAPNIGAAWPEVPREHAGSLAEAVDRAFAAARRLGATTVLLSPGCASYDMFRDYEDRGRRFKAEVARLAGREAHA